MTDHYTELKETVDKFISIIDKYRKCQNILIEVQLGINDEDDGFINGFNCEEFYQKVYNTLNSFKKWDKKYREQYYNIYENDYIHTTKSIDNIKYNTKEIIERYIFNYKNTPYDFRILVMRVLNNNVEQINNNDIYYKYNCTNFNINQNKIQLYIEEKDDKEVFEINQGVNFSFINLDKSEYSSKYLAHDILLKLRDIINICETIEKAQIVNS